jgi:molybdenum-dependent DNA-binding transcriptional regulator ModE
MAPGDIADELGITIEHLRYIIRANPNDGEALAAGAPARVRLAASTTPEELRLLIGEGHRLRDIAHRHDVGRQTLRDELVAHGIPIPPKNPPAYRIDRDWLHEQYVVKQRTMPDIAAETGASGGTIWRLIHEYGIPARGRGAPSHQQSLTAGNGYPDPLARAVLRPGGHERVKRFQVYARTRSLNVAATRLGVHQATLTTQLTMLENACEGQLLNRLTRDQRPQQLTELGRILLHQADRHLGPHPDAPPDLPMPLAAALAAHWGPKMVATLAAAVRFATLTEAADGLGRDWSSLLRTIRNLERAVGEPLITGHARTVPLRLTPLGGSPDGPGARAPWARCDDPCVVCYGSDFRGARLRTAPRRCDIS